MDSSNSLKKHVEYLTTVSDSKHFLNSEFLIWLWFNSETTKNSTSIQLIKAKKALKIDFWIDDSINLESSVGHILQSNLKGSDPSKSPEAHAALKSRKKIKQLKLGINIKEHGDFTCILNATDLAPRSLKLPEINKEVDGYGVDVNIYEHRISKLELFTDVLDSLFKNFLTIRVDKNSSKQMFADIDQWLIDREEQVTYH